MSRWPAARQLNATVDNELWRSWDDDSAQRIVVAQTIPATIANRAIPALGASADAAVAEATQAIDEFRSRAAVAAGALGHLSAVLIRADAVASSQIENITTSSEALAIALAELSGDEPGAYPTATELVAANVTTALSTYQAHDEVDETWFHRRHRRLLASDPELLRRHLGAWRDCAVWIGATRQAADFEGPPHGRIPALMDDLVRFVQRSDVHRVVHAAIGHAQFETIHPYADGNGRVGRLLIHQLLGAGSVPVPVAHGLLHDPTGYVGGLTAYRNGDLDGWIATFAAAVAEGARAAIRLAERIDGIAGEYRRRVRTRSGSTMSQILGSLLHTPAITAREIQMTYGLTPGRASQILHQLAEDRHLASERPPCRASPRLGRA